MRSPATASLNVVDPTDVACGDDGGPDPAPAINPQRTAARERAASQLLDVRHVADLIAGARRTAVIMEHLTRDVSPGSGANACCR